MPPFFLTFPGVLLLAIPIAIGSVLYLALAAVLLRFACALSNRLMPRKDSDTQFAVPVPTIGQGMVIQFFVPLVAGVVTYFAGGMLTSAVFADPNISAVEFQRISMLVSLPINFLISSSLYARTLPTGFWIGCLVNFVQTVLLLVILLPVALLVFMLIYTLS